LSFSDNKKNLISHFDESQEQPQLNHHTQAPPLPTHTHTPLLTSPRRLSHPNRIGPQPHHRATVRGSVVALQNTGVDGVCDGVPATRAGLGRGMDPDCGQPAAAAARGEEGPTQGRGREDAHQRERPSLRDMAQHARKVPRHPAGQHRARVLLRRGRVRVLFRPRPRDLPAHPQLLPHGQAALSAARVPAVLRRGAGIFRHPARRHRRLLLRGLPRPEARKHRATHGRQAERGGRGQSAGADEQAGKDVASIRESAHVDLGAGVLLRDGILHCRVRHGECHRNW
jgi:hypothetical protein